MPEHQQYKIMCRLTMFLILCFLTPALYPRPAKAVAKPTAKTIPAVREKPILPGAYMLKDYLPLLQNKKVGVFANHTAMVGNTHLVDTLRNLGIAITKIFGPEHGFRGTANAGEHVRSYIDEKTGIPVFLYTATNESLLKPTCLM